MKHTPTLTRNGDDDAVFRANAADEGRVTLDNVSWFMPHFKPALKEESELYKIIEREEKLPVGYRIIQSDSIAVPRTTLISWRLAVESSPEVP